MFKDKLNLLYVSDIGEFLPDYDTRYIVIPFSSDEFFIQLEPSLYLGKLKDIYEFICYDYDQLDINLQKKYKNNFKQISYIFVSKVILKLLKKFKITYIKWLLKTILLNQKKEICNFFFIFQDKIY